MDVKIQAPVTFDWDTGNHSKNKEKHDVEVQECEEVFTADPYIMEDVKHSQKEKRYVAFGRTLKGRQLFIVYTVRNEKVRIVSARDQNKKERRFIQSVLTDKPNTNI
jgi:hypothetical protein